LSAPLQPSVPGPLVLVVEDEPQVVRFLDASLAAQGYRVVAAGNGEQGLRLAAQYVPDLVLLDLGLPDLDGVEVLRRLRVWFRAPVLILSARGQERAKVAALDAGADDYLTKPFGVPELLARMRVALRHAARSGSGADAERVQCGPVAIDLGARRVTRDGEPVHLTPIEFKLLSVLARNAGKVVTQKQLLEEVWGPHSRGDAQYLRVYMTHLRRKLQPPPGRGRLFTTEAGVGYRLECD
jgi:two-component system KDP operon response regulator KdpE